MLIGSLLVGVRAECASLQRYESSEGKLRIEGRSVVHDWQAETQQISGFLEIGPDFSALGSKSLTPTEVTARAEVSIPVHSLKSIEKDGRPYSDRFDEILYEKLATPAVRFELQRLVCKGVENETFTFNSTGRLVIGGVTNVVNIPLDVRWLSDGRLRLTGSTTVKQTDFKIPPPIIDTDQPRKDYSAVRIIFDWTVKEQKPK